MSQPFKKLITRQRVRSRDREKKERYLERLLTDPKLSDTHKILLNAFCARYRTKHGKPLGSSSKINYLVSLRAFLLTCPHPVQDVTREDLEYFFTNLTISSHTINSYRLLLRSFFQWFYLKRNSQTRTEKKHSPIRKT